MTLRLEVNRVLDAHTEKVLGDRATQRLVDECAASRDGRAFAHFVNDADGHYWDYGHTAGYLNRSEVRIAIPMLTEHSTVVELALLLDARGVRLTKLVRSSVYGNWLARVRREGSDCQFDGVAVEPHEAINAALRLLETV